MPNIRIDNLSVTYLLRKNEIPAVKNLNCLFEDGKISSILGASGSGKTSILRAICHSLEYDGEIFFDNVNILSKTKKALNISYVSQEYVLFPNLTIYENLAYPLKIAKMDDEEIDKRVLDVAYLLKLMPCLTRLPKHLSLGQQQRVALGRALIKLPSVLLLDEPFSNLDKELTEELLPLLKRIIRKNKMTCIYVTHDLKETISLADKFYFMDEGEIVFTCDKQSLFTTDNPIVKTIVEDSGVENEKKKRS